MQQNTSGDDIAAQIDETTSTVSGDLTSVPLPAAAGVITKWQQVLQASDSMELQSIAQDLAQLEGHLSGGSPDKAAVGALLNTLGEKVSAVAVGQTGIVSTSLTQLGIALSSGGAKLSA